MHEQAARARFLFAKHFSSREHSNRLALITRSPEKAGHLEREREGKKHIFNLHFSFRSWALYFSEQVFCAARFLRRGLRDIQTCLLLKSLVFWPRHFSCKAPHTIIHTHTVSCELAKSDYFSLLSLPFPLWRWWFTRNRHQSTEDSVPLQHDRKISCMNFRESQKERKRDVCDFFHCFQRKTTLFFLIFFTTALTNIRVPVRASPK